jgi:hypothetical protein
MRRALGVVALSGLLLIVPMSGSSAGGGNWIEFRQPPVVGASITGVNRFFDRADVSRPPYYAYLLKGPISYPVPLRLFRNATVLGRVDITWPGPETGWTGMFKNNPKLRFKATVPHVAPGRYVVAICNRPCTDVLRDVHPTTVTVYGTPLEARLTARIDALEGRVIDLRYDARRDRRQAEKGLQKDLGDTAERLDAEVNSLERELAALQAGLRSDSRGQRNGWAEIALAGLIALSLGIGGGIAVGRRQRLPVDWDQLLEEARRTERVGS